MESIAELDTHDMTLGVDEIDREHLSLVNGLESLRQALYERCQNDHISSILLNIRHEAEAHFKTESALMLSHNYPALDKHNGEHKQFMLETHALEATLITEEEPERKAALVDHFLSNWLIKHIVEEDRNLAQFLIKRNRRGDWQIWQKFKGVGDKLIERIFGESNTAIYGLLVPWHHSSLLNSYRAKLLISRVRLLALLFSVMTPLWIFFDYLFFPADLALKLAVGRIAATGGFVFLTFFQGQSDRISHAYMVSCLLFLIPFGFFVFIADLFAVYPSLDGDFSAGLATGYLFLPFIMAAGLSMFPLTALEGAVLALPSLLAQAFSLHTQINFGGVSNELGILWLLLLITGIAILAGMSQLHFWSALVNKTSRDPLTGAYNRATGQELMEKYFYLARRAKTPLAVMFFDLDDFKSVNDLYGHEAGDETLKIMTAALGRSTRKMDLVIRWGGEEFLAFMPLSQSEDLDTSIHRVCKQNNLGQRPDGKPITASVGVAEFLTDGPTRLSQFIALADHRMYLAKKSGKNRVCFGDGDDDMTEIGTFG
jgi:diguanylate cyclase